MSQPKANDPKKLSPLQTFFILNPNSPLFEKWTNSYGHKTLWGQILEDAGFWISSPTTLRKCPLFPKYKGLKAWCPSGLYKLTTSGCPLLPHQQGVKCESQIRHSYPAIPFLLFSPVLWQYMSSGVLTMQPPPLFFYMDLNEELCKAHTADYPLFSSSAKIDFWRAYDFGRTFVSFCI